MALEAKEVKVPRACRPAQKKLRPAQTGHWKNKVLALIPLARGDVGSASIPAMSQQRSQYPEPTVREKSPLHTPIATSTAAHPAERPSKRRKLFAVPLTISSPGEWDSTAVKARTEALVSLAHRIINISMDSAEGILQQPNFTQQNVRDVQLTHCMVRNALILIASVQKSQANIDLQ